MLASDTNLAKYSASTLSIFTEYGNSFQGYQDKNTERLPAELRVKMPMEDIIEGLTGMLQSKHTTMRTSSARALASIALHGE